MAKVQLCNIIVMDNPSPFNNPFQFEITFECIEELKEDLEWKMIYVGSAESEEHDQILDSVYVGPIPEGRHMFVFQADPPDTNKIPEQDAIGVTVVLLTCQYKGQEFIRVGYYINNEYSDPELRENLPSPPQYDKVIRNILESKPRVTRYKINWDDTPPNSTNNESTPNEEASSSSIAMPSTSNVTNTYTADISYLNGTDSLCATNGAEIDSEMMDSSSMMSLSLDQSHDNSNSMAQMECA